jgi:two-component system nitrogen regulation response regulator NtrX
LYEGSGGHPPGVDPLLVESLCLYDWPLNVRELVTLVRRLLVLHGHERSLRLEHLPRRLRDPEARAGGSSAGRAEGDAEPSGPRDQVERDDFDFARLLAALRRCGGNVSRAAATVGMSRQRAYRLMQARPDLDLDELRSRDGKAEGGP